MLHFIYEKGSTSVLICQISLIRMASKAFVFNVTDVDDFVHYC